MPQDDPSGGSHRSAGGRFDSTHWSIVLAAAQTQSPEAQQALETLCRTYWRPLYAYLRRKGYGPPAAEDLTQDFFARRVITKLIFKGIHPGQGKFRTWLLNSMQNLALNERDRQQAQKRGGDQPHCSLDFQDAEGRYLTDPGHALTPEKIYERTWAMTLLEHALAQLENQCEQEGKATLFSELKCYLPGALSRRPYAETAVRLGKSEEALKMAVSRLRQQYGQLLRAEIQRTVSSPTEVQEELRHLLGALTD